MAPHGRVVWLLGLCVLAVCVSRRGPAEAGPLPQRCGPSQQLTADYSRLATDDETTIRIRICECRPSNWQFFELMVAESEELCRRGRLLSRLRWYHQLLFNGVSCVVTEPVDFDPALYDDDLLLCPDNQPNWHNALTLASSSSSSSSHRLRFSSFLYLCQPYIMVYINISTLCCNL